MTKFHVWKYGKSSAPTAAGSAGMNLGRYAGLMCIGGGMGAAGLFEVL